MKKLLVALTAALGVAAASVPASAGGSVSFSTGYYTAPAYSYHAPSYVYTTPGYGYGTPFYSYVAPRYHAPAPVVTFSYGPSYHTPYRAYRGHRHHRKALRRHARHHGYIW